MEGQITDRRGGRSRRLCRRHYHGRHGRGEARRALGRARRSLSTAPVVAGEKEREREKESGERETGERESVYVFVMTCGPQTS